MTPTQVTEETFDATIKQGLVLRDGVLLALQPGMVPAAGLDGLIRKVRALDMHEVQKSQVPPPKAAATPRPNAEPTVRPK
jgi:hypothetical protein